MSQWAAIIQEHGPKAFQTAWRILGHVQDTEDAVQEALVEVFRAHCRQEVRNWEAYLRTTVTCRAIDRLRQRRTIAMLPDEVLSRRSDGPEQVAEAHELAAWLRAAIAALPERQAGVFSLRYFGDLSNSEIAIALKISSEAVAAALHKARTSLARSHQASELAPRSSQS